MFRNIKIRSLAKKRLSSSKSTAFKEIVPLCGFEPFEIHEYGAIPFVVDVSRMDKMCPIIVWDDDGQTAQQRIQDAVSENGYRGYSAHSQPIYDRDFYKKKRRRR